MPGFSSWESPEGPFPAPVKKYNRTPKVNVTQKFDFNKGSNTLRFQGTGSTPDLDRIVVTLPGANDKLPKPKITPTTTTFTDSVIVVARDSVQPSDIYFSQSGKAFAKVDISVSNIKIDGTTATYTRNDPFIVLKDSATVKVYAAATGFDNSDTVTVLFCKGTRCPDNTPVRESMLRMSAPAANVVNATIIDPLGRIVVAPSQRLSVESVIRGNNLKPGFYVVARTSCDGTKVLSGMCKTAR
jgi:hypothetical protein